MARAENVVPSSLDRGLSRRWLMAIVTAAILSLGGKVAIAAWTFGSTDALLWEASLRQLREAGPVALYEDGTVLRTDEGTAYHTEVFNHPPLMVRLLSLGGWIAGQTRIPLHVWLRVVCAIADFAGILLILGIIRQARLPISPAAMFLVAASPISLLISGFHGNTDPIMMFLLLLAVYLLSRDAPLRAGAALGLAVGIKIVPLLFAPALAFSLPARKRGVFLAGAIGVFLAGLFPLAFDHPHLIWSHVFGYSPQTGIWGISRLVAAFGTETLVREYARLAKGVLLVLLGAASIGLNLYRPGATPVVLQCGLLAFILLSLTPGFGVQYLAWLIPWVFLLTWRQAVAFHSVGGLFLAWYYTRGANGFPWYLANSATTQVWNGSLVFVGLLCWLVVVSLTFSIYRRTISWGRGIA
ncbi:MAG: DUF2029 domain-containing protein [Acidobacteriota bacterium]|nr:DUF2029 domain-containing protein [Acidobacteriota bacterium]